MYCANALQNKTNKKSTKSLYQEQSFPFIVLRHLNNSLLAISIIWTMMHQKVTPMLHYSACRNPWNHLCLFSACITDSSHHYIMIHAQKQIWHRQTFKLCSNSEKLEEHIKFKLHSDPIYWNRHLHSYRWNKTWHKIQ